MNILYISHLSGSQYGGPNYSVPAQVSAQATVDNVFWYNLSAPVMEHWTKTGLFHNTAEYPDKTIAALPAPFNKPDLVVFEDFYYIDDCKLGRECRRHGIPYVIVPRGALTKKAQHTKRAKKLAANAIFFRPFTRGAAAIEYLTASEKENSGTRWNKKAIILPNGVNRIPYIDRQPSDDAVSGVYIGRFTAAKGLDLLVEAVSAVQDLMRDANVHISLYGPKTYDLWGKTQEEIVQKQIDDILSLDDAVVGEEKDKVLRSADFFIMTSRFEGMPMGLVEALGYSLPCVVSSGTNMRREVESANAGWGCDTDVQSIAGALSALCGDKEKLFACRKNAFELAGEYEWTALARKAHGMYESIVKERENTK